MIIGKHGKKQRQRSKTKMTKGKAICTLCGKKECPCPPMRWFADLPFAKKKGLRNKFGYPVDSVGKSRQ